MALEKKTAKRESLQDSNLWTGALCAAVAVGVVPLFAVVGGEKSHTWRGLAPQLPGKSRNLVKLFLSFRLQQVDKSAKVGQKWLQNSKLVARYKS